MGFGKDGTGAIIRENTLVSLGALAAGDVVRFPTIGIGEDFRIMKSQITAFVEALTADQGQGLLFGIANAELSVSEIEECLDLSGPTDMNDRISVERAERNVKVLSQAESNPESSLQRQFRGEGASPILVSKHRWTYSNPEGWNFFIYNDGLTLTTGATARLQATHYGMWVK